MRVLLSMVLLATAWCQQNSEFGTYSNPSPRPYERCDAIDLIKLTECCNDVLSKLSNCKADDLACECCALQSLRSECYNLCPRNPSNNFLSVLFKDCEHLNDINACNLPFKKEDGLPEKDSVARKKADRMAAILPGEYESSVIIKSKMNLKDTEEQKTHNLMYLHGDDLLDEEEPPTPSVTINPLSSALPNVSGMYSTCSESSINQVVNSTKSRSDSSKYGWCPYGIISIMLFHYLAT